MLLSPNIYLRATRSNDPSEVKNLLASIDTAKECKRLLRRNQHAEQTLQHFVMACAQSIFCLDFLQDSLEALSLMVTSLEGQYYRDSSRQRVLPHVFKAAKAILMSHKLMHMDEEALKHMLTSPCTNSISTDMHWTMMMYGVRDKDILWLISWSCFKMALNEAIAYKGHFDDDELHFYSSQAREHSAAMKRHRAKHPVTLQAETQVSCFFLDLELSQHPEFCTHWTLLKPEVLASGYEAALEQYNDAALAVQHVVHGLYVTLQACVGSPDRRIHTLLQQGADRIMYLVHQMQNEWHVWDLVKDKLIASMLALGYLWPLDKVLKDHALVSFIADEHRRRHQQLLNTEALRAAAQKDGDDSQDSDGNAVNTQKGSPPKGNKDDQCTWCNKIILLNADKVICQQCHAAVYCSAYCQKKDAQHNHKTACKQARLKSKLAAKGES